MSSDGYHNVAAGMHMCFFLCCMEKKNQAQHYPGNNTASNQLLQQKTTATCGAVSAECLVRGYCI